MHTTYIKNIHTEHDKTEHTWKYTCTYIYIRETFNIYVYTCILCMCICICMLLSFYIMSNLHTNINDSIYVSMSCVWCCFGFMSWAQHLDSSTAAIGSVQVFMNIYILYSTYINVVRSKNRIHLI